FGAAAVEAVRLMDKEKRPKVWTQAITNSRYEELGKPDVSIDISNHFDRKMEAIMAHKSQASGIISQFHEGEHADLVKEAQKHLRSEEHTSELQSRFDLVCRLLLEKKKKECKNNT